jgi:hypothetical protein
VTIAAGFCCRGGLVLAADSEMTIPDSLKYEEFKVTKLDFEGLKGGISGAGDWDYLRMAFQKVVARLQVNPTDPRLAVEETVLEIYNNHVAAYPYEPKPSFDLLVGIREHDGLFSLIRSSQTAVRRSLTFEFLGVGAILGRYLADTMYSIGMSLRQASLMAIYILRLAKKYVPGCGGHSDILVIDSQGNMEFLQTPGIAALEENFSEFDEDVNRVLLGFADLGISDEDFENKLGILNSAIRRFRKKQKEAQSSLYGKRLVLAV